MNLSYSFLFFLLVFAAIFKISVYFRPASRELKRLLSINEGNLLDFINEASQGLETIRIFQKESHFTQKFLSILNKTMNSYVLSETIFLCKLIQKTVKINPIILTEFLRGLVSNFAFEYIDTDIISFDNFG